MIEKIEYTLNVVNYYLGVANGYALIAVLILAPLMFLHYHFTQKPSYKNIAFHAWRGLSEFADWGKRNFFSEKDCEGVQLLSVVVSMLLGVIFIRGYMQIWTHAFLLIH